jgi:hypothetical protein
MHIEYEYSLSSYVGEWNWSDASKSYRFVYPVNLVMDTILCTPLDLLSIFAAEALIRCYSCGLAVIKARAAIGLAQILIQSSRTTVQSKQTGNL